MMARTCGSRANSWARQRCRYSSHNRAAITSPSGSTNLGIVNTTSDRSCPAMHHKWSNHLRQASKVAAVTTAAKFACEGEIGANPMFSAEPTDTTASPSTLHKHKKLDDRSESDASGKTLNAARS